VCVRFCFLLLNYFSIKPIILTSLIFYATCLAAACHYAYSSHLLGVFLSGIAFCRIKGLGNYYEENVTLLGLQKKEKNKKTITEKEANRLSEMRS